MFDDDDDLASVLVPVAIGSSMITSMTAGGVALPEDPTAPWAIGSTYALGARVHSVATHRVYESLKDGNLNKDPTDPVNRNTSTGVGTWWIDIGPTNKFAAFDGLINSQTSGASPLVIKVQPGAFNGFALLGIDADSVSVVAKSAPGGSTIYTYGDDLEGSEPADWYEYFFDRFKPQTQVIATNIEPYGSSEVTITLTKATGLARVGMIAIGDLRPLGIPERNTRVMPKTYSFIDEDAYGNVRIQRRPKARPMSMQIKVALEEADQVVQTIEDVLDVPAVFIGSVAQFHSKLTTFGLISGEMDYSTYPYRTLSVSIKGFI